MRGRDLVDLLEPATDEDEYTEETVPDWKQEPTVHEGVPASVDPLSSDEQTVTADTVISRWKCYLPADCGITSDWRIRWNGNTHVVDGEVETWRGRLGAGHLAVTMKRIAK